MKKFIFNPRFSIILIALFFSLNASAQCVGNKTTPHSNVTPGAAGTPNCATTADLMFTKFNVTTIGTTKIELNATVTNDFDDDARGTVISILLPAEEEVLDYSVVVNYPDGKALVTQNRGHLEIIPIIAQCSATPSSCTEGYLPKKVTIDIKVTTSKTNTCTIKQSFGGYVSGILPDMDPRNNCAWHFNGVSKIGGQ